MMMKIILALAAIFFCSSCSSSPGRPKLSSGVVSPDDISDFGVLYNQNCAGCHGLDGKGGAAIALASPVFLAIADDDSIRRVVSNGVTFTAMPAFAQSSGGMLTQKQIDALVRGIRSWENPRALANTTPPAYAPKTIGNAHTGEQVFRTYCASCHGTDGRGGRKASSIVDRSYLALVSDQYFRTIVITGRPELGAPDWRGDVEGRAMSEPEISDVVAWLSSQRPPASRDASVSTSVEPNQGASK